jgi:hypothetical protein
MYNKRMNILFNTILFFLGLRKDYKKSKSKLKNIIKRKIDNNDFKKIINLNNNRTITNLVYKNNYQREFPVVHIKTTPVKKLREKLYTPYNTFIIILLSIQPIYTLVYIINIWNEKTNFYISNLFFQLIPISQYILAIGYFHTNKFENFYNNYEKFDNVCFPKIDNIIKFITSITLISSFVNTLILHKYLNDGEFPGFTELGILKRVIITIFLILSWTYGKLIVYLNICCFSLIFCKHYKIIKQYKNKIEKIDCEITINEILENVIIMRHDLENSIDSFKNIFSLFTLFGAIGFGFIFERIKQGEINFFQWNSLITHLIVQSIFIIVIINVAEVQDSMANFIKEPIFVQKYLRKLKYNEVEELVGNDKDLIIINISEENATSFDWIILYNMLTEKWTNFSVMGIEIEDGGNLIKKGIVFVTLFLAFFN